MVIVGIGTDLVKISRIRNVCQKYGDRFLKKAYSNHEIATYQERVAGNEQRGMEYLASRWALKEATYKILSGETHIRIPFPDISSTTDPSGKLCLDLKGLALDCAQNLHINRHHVSISHEFEYTNAMVVLEKE